LNNPTINRSTLAIAQFINFGLKTNKSWLNQPLFEIFWPYFAFFAICGHAIEKKYRPLFFINSTI
jgi:hypothetical protein